MANRIKRSDISEEDLFKEIKESAENTIKTLEKVNIELTKMAQTLKNDLGQTVVKTAKDIDKMTVSAQKATKIKEQAIKADKDMAAAIKLQATAEVELERIKQAKLKTEAQEMRNASVLAKENERKAKASEKAAKAAANEASAYKQLERNTRELKNQSKELGAQMLKLEQNGKKNSAEYNKLASEYKKVTSAAQKGDSQLKKLDKTVGDNFRNVGNYKSALGGLKSVLGAFGVGFGVSQIKNFITDTIELSRVQEKAVAQVAAGLKSTGGAVGFTLDELKAKASALQKETLFGDETILTDLTSIMLTFTNVTGEAFDRAQQSALDLSTRMGGDLKGAAVQLGKALNDPVKGVTALSRVGVSFTEEQKEQIATLTESGKLYEAQTVILDEMNKEFAGSAKAAAEADGGITQLSNAFGDAKEELGKMLLEGLKPMIQGLKEFFENLSTQDIRGFVQTLGSIFGVVMKVVKAFLIYKGVQQSLILIEKMRALSLANFGKNLAAQIPLTRAYRLEQIKSARAAQQAGEATKGAGRAMSAVPWVLIIGAVIELARSFYDAASGAAALRKQQELNEAFEQAASDRANQRVTDRTKALDKELSALQRKQQEELAAAKTDKDRAALEKKFAQQREQNISNTQKQVKADISAVQGRKKAFEQDLAQLELLNKQKEATSDRAKQNDIFVKQMELAGKIAEKYGVQGDDAKLFGFIPLGTKDSATAAQVIRGLTARIEAANEKLEIYGEELSSVSERTKDAASELKVLNTQEADNTNKITAKIPKMKELKTELSEVNEYLSKQSELLAKIESIEFEKAIAEKTDAISEALSNAIAKAKETGEIFSGEQGTTDQFGEQFTDLEALINERYDIEKGLLEQQQAEKLRLLESQYQEQAQQELESLIDSRDELLKQEGLTASQKEEIQKQYEAQLEVIRQNNLQRNADLELEKVILAQETAEALKDIDSRRNEEVDSANEELIAAQIEYYDKQNEIAAAAEAERLAKEAENVQRRIALAEMLNDAAIKASNERIAQIDKELEANRQAQDTLRELSRQGSDDAKESLAEQVEAARKLEAEKRKELRKQERIQLITTAYTTYQGKVAAGSKKPLAETIRDLTLLKTFINTLPLFEKGTEDTGTNGRGVDGRGGFHAVLHPNERVMTKEQNMMVGNMSNMELAKLAADYQAGKVVSMGQGATQLTNGWKDAALIAKLNQINETILNKPEYDIRVEEVVDGVLKLIKTEKRGNSVIYNKYRYK